MKSFDNKYFNPVFSHIYVEKDVKNLPRTRRILEKFPHAVIVEIEHYKDIFCRGGQNYGLQHRTQNLILATKPGELIYKGAMVCQSFGQEHFYYTSCMMNCVYDCEYCYLKGMYPSGNVVVFVNIEDIFADVDRILKEHAMYLCVSYDTDMMAMENLTGYTKEWVEFAKERENLTIEIRTKCANHNLINQLPAQENVIYAFTISPQTVIDEQEHGTPSLKSRIACAREALDKGMKVRLCFDPMIYCVNWKEHYEAMLFEIIKEIKLEELVDVSVGSFRVSQDYLKKMRKNNPQSAVVWFPFENDGGVYHYPKELMEEMEQYLTNKLRQWIGEEKIFRWAGDNA